MKCPRCLGKGFVDNIDIKRLGMEAKWAPGHCRYCDSSGVVEAGKPKYEDPRGTKSGCFIATAVYDNYNHPTVIDLRYFRDYYLDQKKWGKAFIKWYYTHSPNWANFISSSRVCRVIAFLFIVKPLHLFVKLVAKNR